MAGSLAGRRGNTWPGQAIRRWRLPCVWHVSCHGVCRCLAVPFASRLVSCRETARRVARMGQEQGESQR
eukprot:11225270-Lingulodinium_polyedra.AAC.1